MKKLFLLLAAGSIAMNVGAQERQGLMNPGPTTTTNVPYYDAAAAHKAHLQSAAGAHKTTTVPTDRWYSYYDWLHTDAQFNATYGYAGDSIVNTSPYMWFDDKSRSIYTLSTGLPGLDTTRFTSYGVVLQPQWAGFNNGKYYPIDEMTIGSGNAYVVDSIEIVGAYLRNLPSKAAVKDTLIVATVHSAYGAKGSADVWSQSVNTTHYGTINFPNISYDSLNNHADGSTVQISKIVMDPADTNANGVYVKVVNLAAYGGVVTCAANDLVGYSVTFKSGDASYVPYDTVFRGSPFVPVVKYNMFRPYIGYTTTGGSSTEWPAYKSTNMNDGLFKTLPDTTNGWGKRYIPTFAWGLTSPGSYQAPELFTHISCPSCTVGVTSTYLNTNSLVNITEVTAVPNPANNQVNISFNLAKASDVKVSLTNVVGQVVATQNMNNTSNGKATFNTAALPSGVYVYTLQANGEKTTGRVVVAH